MRKRAGIFRYITIAIAGIAASIAQQQRSAEAPSSGSARLGSGTLVVAELSRGLSSKHAKAGDIIKAKVIQDVIAGGRIVAPRDSKMLGIFPKRRKWGSNCSSGSWLNLLAKELNQPDGPAYIILPI
jgi:hypothetical protein